MGTNMNNQTFSIILTIFGLILTSSIHGAPGVTDRTQSTNETSTEISTQINETLTGNHTNSTNAFKVAVKEVHMKIDGYVRCGGNDTTVQIKINNKCTTQAKLYPT